MSKAILAVAFFAMGCIVWFGVKAPALPTATETTATKTTATEEVNLAKSWDHPEVSIEAVAQRKAHSSPSIFRLKGTVVAANPRSRESFNPAGWLNVWVKSESGQKLLCVTGKTKAIEAVHNASTILLPGSQVEILGSANYPKNDGVRFQIHSLRAGDEGNIYTFWFVNDLPH